MKPVAAVAVIWNSQHDQVLVIRRSERPGDPWSGHWALPGGKREAGDNDLLATAIRETHEECAITLERDGADALPVTPAGRVVGRPLAVAPYLFTIDHSPTITPEPGEVGAWHWLPCVRLRDRSCHRRGPVREQHPDERWPHIVVDGHPLWGFTYQVLCAWADHHRSDH